jgi:hypothetical protein
MVRIIVRARARRERIRIVINPKRIRSNALLVIAVIAVCMLFAFIYSNPYSTKNVLLRKNLDDSSSRISFWDRWRSKPQSESQLKAVQTNVAKDVSSIDYMACCGLGHRLSKFADAHYVAKQLGFGLRSFWGYCEETEVFHYLFGPQPIDELLNLTTPVKGFEGLHRSHYIRINNDVGEFGRLRRNGDRCPCSFDKLEEDVRFYSRLRKRFRFKDEVDAYRAKHFQNKTIIGVHIRAGNGETGDFTDKGRGIKDVEMWTKNLVDRILEMQGWNRANAALFLATDTPAMIQKLQVLLNSTMDVMTLEQTRPEEGVFFGQTFSKTGDCLDGWKSAVKDMMLLSHTDVIIAATPSSFSQSLPMALSLGRPKAQRRVTTPFCEVDQNATEMRCYNDVHDWCCNGNTQFILEGIQKYEYIRMPSEALDPSIWQKKVMLRENCFPRPNAKQICLPYDWSKYYKPKRIRIRIAKPVH